MNLRNKKWKLVSTLLSGALLLSVVSGCSGDGKDGSNAGKKVSITVSNYDIETLKDDSPYIKRLRELSGYDIDFTWVPVDKYKERLSTSIAGENLTDIVVGSSTDGPIYNAIKSGLFWEVGPYLKEFPNLAGLNEQVLNNTKVDGKIYGVYRARPLSREGIIFRKDWLDNLGLEAPDTYDEFIDLLYAFTNDDPDGNGKDDTYGIFAGGGNVRAFLTMHGVAQKWHLEEDGTINVWFLTEPFKDVVRLFKKMYDDGVIPTDYLLLKEPEEMNKSHIGIKTGALDDVDKLFKELPKLTPTAVLDVMQYPKGPDGVRRAKGTSGFNGMYMIPKTSVKTEERLKEVLGFLDMLWSPDGQNLFNWGLEDVNYKVEDGKAIVTNPDFGKNAQDIFQIRSDDGKKALPGAEDAVNSKVKKLQTESESFAIFDPTTNIDSETYNERGKQLEKDVEAAMNKYITGEIAEDELDKAIQSWKELGGDQILKEFNEAYQKQNSN
ncbi:extracellular solute-binding protein [Paenibacillus sp. J5C_2022]|uniref:extracellular solute-binding protein n=1 Tax=Paenibacillus sp. J5C2022 TaxID=2977129 RepID=UPI0021D3CF38|nr:extracellular solute-binding protein [Paenibacillus sp. J5C2022]MCU6712749.1 extracellular solute-binding protein [Paenibacillus sp. J5C2022]